MLVSNLLVSCFFGKALTMCTPSTDSEEMIQRILSRLEAQLRKKLVSGPQTLQEIEEQSEEIGEDLKRVIDEEVLHEKPKEACGPRVSCVCGKLARYAGMRKRQVITRHGLQGFCRAYYHCSSCGLGWCPFDQTLQLDTGQCSRIVVSLIARFCSYLPYRTAAQELEAICGLRLSVVSVKECPPCSVSNRRVLLVGGVKV